MVANLNTAVIYHGILTLEYVDTVVNYHRIFITLAPYSTYTCKIVYIIGQNFIYIYSLPPYHPSTLHFLQQNWPNVIKLFTSAIYECS